MHQVLSIFYNQLDLRPLTKALTGMAALHHGIGTTTDVTPVPVVAVFITDPQYGFALVISHMTGLYHCILSKYCWAAWYPLIKPRLCAF